MTHIDVVRAAWADLLGVAGLEPDDDFFAKGGDSLRLLTLAERLREVLRRDVPAHRLLANPTVAGMAAALDNLTPPAATPPPGRRAVPTSVWQARAVELARLGDGTVPAAYAFTLTGSGTPNPTEIQTALRAVILRHTALRTYFPTPGTLVARLAEPSELDCPLRMIEQGAEDHALAAPFDPATPPLVRAILVVRPGGYTLGIAASDLVMDPRSVPAFLGGLESGTGSSDFTALAAAERKWLSSTEGRHAADRAATGWTAAEPLPFPALGDPPAPPARHDRVLTADTVRRIARFCREHRVTPFTTLTAATLLALRHRTGQPDPAVLLRLARREDATGIGPYENGTPLRPALEPDGDLAQTAQRVRDAVVGAVPYESLVERLTPGSAPQVSLRLLPLPRPSRLGEFDWLMVGRPPAGLDLTWLPDRTGGAVLRGSAPGEWAGEVAALLAALDLP